VPGGTDKTSPPILGTLLLLPRYEMVDLCVQVEFLIPQQSIFQHQSIRAPPSLCKSVMALPLSRR